MELNPQYQQMTREQIEAHIKGKATQDSAFRNELIADPRAALGKEIGLVVPAGFKLQVIEETSDSMSIVLPPAAGELSDMELEAVAGGKGGPAPKVSNPGKIGGGGRLIGQDGQG